MRHNPERLAAAYLGREMNRRRRARFERHVLECERCWAELRAARAGRALAESLRLAAPAHLRDRVRAVVDLEPAPARPRRVARVAPLAVGLVLVAASAVGVAQMRDPAQPREIAGVVAAYTGSAEWPAAPARSQPPKLAGLRWLGSGIGRPGGLPVVADRYVAADGGEVVVVRSSGRFPRAAGARPVAGGDWVAEVAGVTVFCTLRPDVALVVGVDRTAVLGAAHDLAARTAE